MDFLRYPAVTLATALLVSGCAIEDALWPSPAEEEAAAPAYSGPAGDPARQPTATLAPPPTGPAVAAATGVAPPLLGTSSFVPPGVTTGSPTGTFVGRKVVELREELQRLQNSVMVHNEQLQELRARVIEDSQRYHGTIAAINSRLQVGTTPGNPILIQQFNAARADLERLAAEIGEMNKLSTAVAGDSTMASFLAESTRATFRVSGAIDEDHRQLAILQDEVDQTNVLVDRLLSELSDDIRRQTEYVAAERGNLNLLASGIRSGEVYGASLMNQAIFSAAGGGGALPTAVTPSADIRSRRPLVVIRFDRPNVAYQQAVYNAVSEVLDRRPGATFDLVAVAPARGGAARVSVETNKARRNAESVMRSLVDMGLPPSRMAMSATTSDYATSNEVHLYVR
ncbi:MAG: hypothetical protein ACFCUO_02655 [Rhodospirillales bacterium]